MPYRATTVAGIGHLGRATYDGEKHVDPTKTICGIPVERWTVREPRFERWGERRAASICPTCDRTVLWELLHRAMSK